MSIKAEPRIKDPNPERTAANWAYIVENERRRKAKEEDKNHDI